MTLTFKEKLREKQAKQLELLLEYFGTKSAISREINLSKQSVLMWFKSGRVSRKGAILLENYDPQYFKKEDLRPDIISW